MFKILVLAFQRCEKTFSHRRFSALLFVFLVRKDFFHSILNTLHTLFAKKCEIFFFLFLVFVCASEVRADLINFAPVQNEAT